MNPQTARTARPRHQKRQLLDPLGYSRQKNRDYGKVEHEREEKAGCAKLSFRLIRKKQQLPDALQRLLPGESKLHARDYPKEKHKQKE